MRITLAYISVVLLWATTPLAIKWSGEGPGFLFAATGRMTVGALCILLTMVVSGQKMAWHRKAWLTYFAVALQIFGTMIAVYWSAQFVPSGWISVIHGLCPLMTALVASIALKEKHLSFSKLVGYGLGIYGLYIMFGSALLLGNKAELGIIVLLVSALIQSASAVWIKRINARLPALTQVAGGLGLAVPCYLLTWFSMDGKWPNDLNRINILSIIYLGMIATTIGFYLYYYLLDKLSAVRVAFISLTTPVMSLFLGHLINHEPMTKQILTGTAFILSALIMHEVFDRFSLIKLGRISKRQLEP